MQTSFYSTTTSCNSNDCTRCVKTHGFCPQESDTDATAETTEVAA